jgi:hypothetical protein
MPRVSAKRKKTLTPALSLNTRRGSKKSDFAVQRTLEPLYFRPIFRRDRTFIHEETRCTSPFFPSARIVPDRTIGTASFILRGFY